MNSTPSFREIAKIANVSVASVSFALGNRPGVSDKTRNHILSVAKSCGYRFNPFVTALMAQKRSRRTRPIQAIMGILTPERMDSITAFPHFTSREFLLGAEEAAKKLGFILEQFPLNEIAHNPRTLRTAMHTRRMNGLIVHMIKTIPDWLALDWNEFAVVSIGQHMVKPCFDFTASDHYGNMILALRELTKLGYKRIGFATVKHWEMFHENRLISAYLGYTWPKSHVPPFVPEESKWDKKNLLSWIEKNKPDAVISTDHTILPWIRSQYRVPEDIGFAHLDLDTAWDNKIAGIQQSNREVGSAAVHIVAGHINRLDFGVPKVSHGQLVEGTWWPGPTVRDQNVRA